jgi:hypothetical protein
MSIQMRPHQEKKENPVKVLLLAFIALGASAQACAQSFTVPAELWDRPRSGTAVMEPFAIRQAVIAWLARPGGRLTVHHGTSPESLVQAEELRAWLISLAIEADHVLLRNDLTPSELLRIEVTRD